MCNLSFLVLFCFVTLLLFFWRFYYFFCFLGLFFGGVKEGFYLMTHSTYLVTVIWRQTCGK